MNDKDLIDQLHELGNHDPGAPTYLAAKVIANLPLRDPFEQALAWFSQTLWKATAAVATPLLIGFTLGISGVANNGADDTAWYDSDYLAYADMLEEYPYDEF